MPISKHDKVEASVQAPSDNLLCALKPITNVFKRQAAVESYVPWTDDERLYFKLTETTLTRPLMLSRSQNRWCAPLVAKRSGFINRHYHPHPVFAYTVSGKWGYLEHDWIATAGDFVYE